MPTQSVTAVKEFKLRLDRSQEQYLAEVQDCLLSCWNRGLALFEWRDYYRTLQRFAALPDVWNGGNLKPHQISWVKNTTEKEGDVWAVCCPLSWELEKEYLDRFNQKCMAVPDTWGFNVQPTKVYAYQTGYGFAYYCSIMPSGRELLPSLVKAHWIEPPLFGEGAETKMVWGAFAQKRWQGKPKNVPQVYVNEFLALVLQPAWDAYKKGVRKHPRYKSSKKSDRVNTVMLRRSGDNIKINREHNTIGLPGFGRLRVVGLAKRLPPDTPIQKVAIISRASGHYLQVTIQEERKLAAPSDVAVGLDLGLQYLYATNSGQTVSPQRQYRKIERRLASLQKRLSPRKGRKFPPQVGSNRYKTAQNRIARLHERARLARRNFNHWHSTHLVRQYGAIALEDLQWNRLNRKPKPIAAPDGNGYLPNGSSRKRGLNKSFADVAIGQFKEMLTTKALFHNRELQMVPAQYTSQECPSCHAIYKKSLSQRTHECPDCGYLTERDVAAAQNILARATFVGNYRTYRRACREVTGVECASRTLNRQPESATIGIVTVSKPQAVANQGRNTSSTPLSQPKDRSLRHPSPGYVQLTIWDSG